MERVLKEFKDMKVDIEKLRYKESKNRSKQHRDVHKILHEYLMEISDDYFGEDEKGNKKNSIRNLLDWSYKETLTEKEKLKLTEGKI